MKRRDFVKIAALLPVAPALVAASQLKPIAPLVNGSVKRLDTDYDALGVFNLDNGGSDTGFTMQHSRINGYWVTFDDVKKQTNFFREQFSNEEDFWHIDANFYRSFNTIHSVGTMTFADGKVTMLNCNLGWCSVWLGAKISINIADSIRIEQTNPQTGTALDWKWTRETYKDTVLRIATKLGAFRPELLLRHAQDENVSQTEIRHWMQAKKKLSCRNPRHTAKAGQFWDSFDNPIERCTS